MEKVEREQTFAEHTYAEKIKAARAEIVSILYKIDEIKLQINPQLEAEYATKIGCLENDLLKWQIAARRAKRSYTLAQAKINAGELPDTQEIEEQLDSEFKEWETKLKKSIHDFMQATQRMAGSKTLLPSESRELKKLYHTIVKRLHPDLNPDLNDDEKHFFAMAKSAYESGNLDLMRSIELSTQGMGGDANAEAKNNEIDNMSDDEAAAEL